MQFTSQETLLNQTFRRSAAVFFSGAVGCCLLQPLKETAADCWSVWFNNISWLVYCTELKPDDTFPLNHFLTFHPILLPHESIQCVKGNLTRSRKGLYRHISISYICTAVLGLVAKTVGFRHSTWQSFGPMKFNLQTHYVKQLYWSTWITLELPNPPAICNQPEIPVAMNIVQQQLHAPQACT